MARFKINQVITATGGELAQGSAATVVNGVTTDSRQAKKGSLFVAIHGQRLDGHNFVRQAFAQGAAAAMVSHKFTAVSTPDKTLVAVGDTTVAYLSLAGYHRASMEKVILAGVTGSNGKTTVKEMIAGALSKKYKTLKTLGNLNNQIGLPQTLLGLKPSHQAAVVEMGINMPGEMELLASAARPNIAVITNIGAAHLERLKSVAQVRREKGKLLDHLAPKGVAVLNASDPNSAPLIKSRQGRPMITFGVSPMGDVSVVENRLDKGGAVRIVKISHRGKVTALRLKSLAENAAINAAAAFAAGVAAGVEPALIVEGIESFRPARLRMALTRLGAGMRLIDDSYNANPASVASALMTIKNMEASEKILVLGDMLELGASAEKAHIQVARQAKAAGVARIFAFG
ncbi:MAG: UDP-N-acetylmuramoyl-tripeptide--D-alanyl-D-alanine ligase, partial [Nitrospinota bacterium]|nr:UDP-N-acetylmuramoyl-tripeptide--D-alanyl-D-alanine ligase [Nitrospinota bacterium]